MPRSMSCLQPLPTSIVHFGTETRFVVPPGGLAYFEVSIGHANVGDEGAPCDPPAAGLLISLPGDGYTLNLPGPWRACGQGWARLKPLHDTPDPNMHH